MYICVCVDKLHLRSSLRNFHNLGSTILLRLVSMAKGMSVKRKMVKGTKAIFMMIY